MTEQFVMTASCLEEDTDDFMQKMWSRAGSSHMQKLQTICQELSRFKRCKNGKGPGSILMKPWLAALQKEILAVRQDAHVTAWKINRDQQGWKAIYEEDQRNAKLYNYPKTQEKKRT